jgi:hypothetical protein
MLTELWDKWNLFMQLSKSKPANILTWRDPCSVNCYLLLKDPQKPHNCNIQWISQKGHLKAWNFKWLWKMSCPSSEWHFNFVTHSFVYKMLLVQEAQSRIVVFVSFTQMVMYFWRSLTILFSIWWSKIVDLIQRWTLRISHSISF